MSAARLTQPIEHLQPYDHHRHTKQGTHERPCSAARRPRSPRVEGARPRVWLPRDDDGGSRDIVMRRVTNSATVGGEVSDGGMGYSLA